MTHERRAGVAIPLRPTVAVIDVGAVVANVVALCRVVAPRPVWVVVKADGYGHGAVPVARAALRAGAAGLCVALVQEGATLRAAGITAPILVLSEPPLDHLVAAVGLGLTITMTSASGVEALARAAAEAGVPEPVPVHVKVDTGMRRVGVAPDQAGALCALVAAQPSLVLEGLVTHLAVADQLDHPFTAVQLERFATVLAELDSSGLRPPLVHVANSAGALLHPQARQDLVRCGIAVYGLSPGGDASAAVAPLRPVLRLVSQVSFVKRVESGEGVSYGLRHVLDHPATVATVPIGYADGVPRRYGAVGGEVLIGGRRRPVLGVVTMDQLMVDCGDDRVERGDEVVLIGAQGDEQVTAEEWAARLGTITYEVVCAISARVPRVVVGDA